MFIAVSNQACHSLFMRTLYFLFWVIAGVAACQPATAPFPHPLLLVGEVTEQSALLQVRLQASDTLIDQDLPGQEGEVVFEWGTDSLLKKPQESLILLANSAQDFSVKWLLKNLSPGQVHYYRVRFNIDGQQYFSTTHRFRTLGAKSEAPYRFALVTGSHYERFFMGGGLGHEPSGQGADADSSEALSLGFPALEAIHQLKPDFFIGNGDNVYYDHPEESAAKTIPDMRAKWHRQFSLPRYRQLFAQTATYWLKDDHDYRFDDADTIAPHKKIGPQPTHADGKFVYWEQVPTTANQQLPNYRTFRLNRDMQIWLLEGRDHRTPNDWPNDSLKTLWGKEQLAWLQQTLLESSATFKLIISPTPLIGPDDRSKRDNHTNPDGFLREGQAFFDWLTNHDFLNKNCYILCGDRHWQYHSIHPSGFEEFSSGALVDQNSRMGRMPGDPASTDPEGKIVQPYTYPQPTGGFLFVRNATESGKSVLYLEFFDDEGTLLHQVKKEAARPDQE